MTGPTPAAAARARRQEELALRTVASMDQLWQYVRGRRITATWRQVADRMLVVLVAAKLASAQGAQEYVTESVTEQGGRSDPGAGSTPRRSRAGPLMGGR